MVSDPVEVAVTVPEVMEMVSFPTNELVPGNVPTSSRTTVKPSLFWRGRSLVTGIVDAPTAATNNTMMMRPTFTARFRFI